MNVVRRLALAASSIVMVATTVATGSVGSAHAASTTTATTATSFANSTTLTATTASSTQSTAVVQWNPGTWALTMTASTGTLATGYCVTAYFDWKSVGHHDARALRDCKSNDTYSFSFPDSNTSNLVNGINRLGLCYGKDNATGTCTFYNSALTSTVPMNWSTWPQPTWANPCVLTWTKRAADGTTSTFVDPHSQRRAAGTC